MKPFLAAQIFGLFGAVAIIRGIVGFVTGCFGLGKSGRFLAVEGAWAYIASAFCCALGIALVWLCIRKTKQGLNERPFRMDYP